MVSKEILKERERIKEVIQTRFDIAVHNKSKGGISKRRRVLSFSVIQQVIDRALMYIDNPDYVRTTLTM